MLSVNIRQGDFSLPGKFEACYACDKIEVFKAALLNSYIERIINELGIDVN